MSTTDRRAFLQTAGMAGMFSAMSPVTVAQAATATPEEAKTTPLPKPKHSIRFGVIGLDHYHIFSMTEAVQRGGGQLVAFYATDPKQIADFRAKFGDVKLARSADEIIEDKSLQLVAAAPVPDERTP